MNPIVYHIHTQTKWLLLSKQHFQIKFSKMKFLNLLKYVPSGLIHNMSSLVQIMAWHWRGDKPLSDQIMTQFTNAYMHHQASMSYGLARSIFAILGFWNFVPYGDYRPTQLYIVLRTVFIILPIDLFLQQCESAGIDTTVLDNVFKIMSKAADKMS